MTARPDASALRGFLARAARRLTLLSAARGAAAGFATASILIIAGWPRNAIVPGIVLGIAGVGLAIAVSRGRRVALLVEQRAPQCRNLVITADELSAQPNVTEPIAALVYARAARLVASLDLAALFPARNALAALAVSGVLWTLGIASADRWRATTASRSSVRASSDAATIAGVDVTITPPAYAARPAQTLRDPARIEALAGSRVRLSVRATAARVAMETLRGRDTLVHAQQDFTGELVADADGYVALEPATAAGRAGARRLIGITVIPDESPRTRIATPGRDLFLKDAAQPIELSIEARDDIGLASLRLRYTKVSGSGERFTFTEGEVPLAIARGDARTWTARATWRIDGLGLGPGDMVVYRAVAADHRPGATPAESDSYIAEILAPGGDAAAGFAVDPEQERYAVSQQMVILKTERLAARRASLSPDALVVAAQDIGAEQKKVRAEFVFMMGGELADAPDVEASMTEINEEAEAAGEEDLLAGRAANQGRVALLRAIRSMSRATAALTTADLTRALTHERAALVQLERAFSRARIILRALTERERLDLSRRLTGVLTDAARATHPVAEPVADARVVALRRALAGIASLSGAVQLRAADASTLGENVLRVDPSDKTLQTVATQLASAATAIARGRTDDARDLLDRAATGIAATLRAELLDAPQSPPKDLDRLGGALTDALRRARPR